MPIRRLFLCTVAAAVLAPAAHAITITIGDGPAIDGSGHVIDDTRAVTPFRRVVVNGPVDVHLKHTGAEKAIVHADDNIAPLIEVRVEGDKLVVQTKKDASYRTRTTVSVTVEFKQLDAVQLNGSGDVDADDIKAGIFEGAVRGSGNLKLAKLDADTVAVSLAGSGDFSARGRADKAGFNIDGSGDIDARGLQARTVAVRIAGSGDAVVCASEVLQVRIAGSGDVRYCGSPRVEKQVKGTGDVTPLR